MAVVTLSEVQAWLKQAKFNLEQLDEDLVAQVEAETFARFAARVDTSAWTTTANTPDLVRAAVAMRVAAWEWRRSASTNTTPPGTITYADKLDAWCDSIIAGVLDGDLVLVDSPDIVTIAAVSGPIFFPTDLEEYDLDFSRRFLLGERY